LVKQWHPDRFTHDWHSQSKAEEKLKEINEAYAALRRFSPLPIGYQTPTPPFNRRPVNTNRQARRPYSPRSSPNGSYSGEYRGPFQYQSTASAPRPEETRAYTVTPQEKSKLLPWLSMMFMLFMFFSNIMRFDTTDTDYALPVVPQARQSTPPASAFLSHINESSLKPKEETGVRMPPSLNSTLHIRVKQPGVQVRISEKDIPVAPWQVPYSAPAVSTGNLLLVTM
jgi:curved DNA-binding protein CbpA